MKTKIGEHNIHATSASIGSERSLYRRGGCSLPESGGINLERFTGIIESRDHDADYYFHYGDYRLDKGKEFLIKGGRSSIAQELDPLKKSKVIAGTGVHGLYLFGCFIRKPIGKDNVTYIMIGPSGFNYFDKNICDKRTLTGGQPKEDEVPLKQVIDAIATQLR